MNPTETVTQRRAKLQRELDAARERLPREDMEAARVYRTGMALPGAATRDLIRSLEGALRSLGPLEVEEAKADVIRANQRIDKIKERIVREESDIARLQAVLRASKAELAGAIEAAASAAYKAKALERKQSAAADTREYHASSLSQILARDLTQEQRAEADRRLAAAG